MLDAPAAAVLITYGPGGEAVASPVWFRYTGNAFEVVVATSDAKFDNLTHDPRAVLIVFETVSPFRGVQVRADAELDASIVQEARRSITDRYLGAERSDAFVAGRGEGIVVRLPASAARTWDLSAILPAGDPITD